MHRLLVALLMILAFVPAVVATPAHSVSIAVVAPAPMSQAPHHAPQQILQDEHAGPEVCQESQVCGAGDALCYFVCSSMATWLAPGQSVSAAPLKTSWGLPRTPNLAGLGPERNERPPDQGLAEYERARIRVPI